MPQEKNSNGRHFYIVRKATSESCLHLRSRKCILNVGLHLGYARALLRYLKRWYDCRKKKDMRIALVAPDIPDYACDFAAVAASRMDVTLFIAKRFCSSHLQSLEKGVVAHWIDWPRQ